MERTFQTYLIKLKHLMLQNDGHITSDSFLKHDGCNIFSHIKKYSDFILGYDETFKQQTDPPTYRGRNEREDISVIKDTLHKDNRAAQYFKRLDPKRKYHLSEILTQLDHFGYKTITVLLEICTNPYIDYDDFRTHRVNAQSARKVLYMNSTVIPPKMPSYYKIYKTQDVATKKRADERTDGSGAASEGGTRKKRYTRKHLYKKQKQKQKRNTKKYHRKRTRRLF
jgi:hypothetical protein